MDPFLFIVGSGRSGTTLIRQILNAHPDLAVPDETHFIPKLARHRRKYESNGFDAKGLLHDLEGFHQFGRLGLDGRAVKDALAASTTYADAIRAIYRLYAAKDGKTRYGDKTPRYCLDMPMLALLFPEARFIHVIRDGRSVALSVSKMSFGPDEPPAASLYWRNRALTARRTGEWLDPERYFEYRHEDLVADPEPITRAVCDFADLAFDPGMLRYHETAEPSQHEHHPHVHEAPRADLRDWRAELDTEDLRLIEILSGDAMDELGYERATDGKTLPAEDEQRLKKRAAKITSKHNDWEAKAFGFVNVPSRRPKKARSLFSRSAKRGTGYSPPAPDEG